MDYESKRTKFLSRLSVAFIKDCYLDAPLPAQSTPSYADVVVGNDRYKNQIFTTICAVNLNDYEFKDIVFEILDSFQFEECSTFTELLQKWKKYDYTKGTLTGFFTSTEPKTNKLPFYKAAFDHLTRINLIEFLTDAISNDELSEEFILSLQNAA
jgi:hypothetical protein